MAAPKPTGWRPLPAAALLLACLAAPAAAQEGFLDFGGSITTEPDVIIDFGAPAQEEFLEDGGSIRTPPDILVRGVGGPERPDQGGSVPAQRSIEAAPDEDGARWRSVRADRDSFAVTSGSFTVIAFRSRAASVPELIVLSPDGTVTTGGGGPRIIDVAAERLDRRPYGPDGVDVSYSGGAKIIRIAPQK